MFAKQHPAKALKRLLGAWHAEATFPNGEVIPGTVTFRWLAEDGLVLMRSKMRRLIPASVAVIGADDVHDQLTMLYSDERGVTRTYEMSMTRTALTWHRAAPKFHQRFESTFGRTKIEGAWQKSVDGRRWEHDFALVYTRR